MAGAFGVQSKRRRRLTGASAAAVKRFNSMHSGRSETWDCRLDLTDCHRALRRRAASAEQTAGSACATTVGGSDVGPTPTWADLCAQAGATDKVVRRAAAPAQRVPRARQAAMAVRPRSARPASVARRVSETPARPQTTTAKASDLYHILQHMLELAFHAGTHARLLTHIMCIRWFVVESTAGVVNQA